MSSRHHLRITSIFILAIGAGLVGFVLLRAPFTGVIGLVSLPFAYLALRLSHWGPRGGSPRDRVLRVALLAGTILATFELVKGMISLGGTEDSLGVVLGTTDMMPIDHIPFEVAFAYGVLTILGASIAWYGVLTLRSRRRSRRRRHSRSSAERLAPMTPSMGRARGASQG